MSLIQELQLTSKSEIRSACFDQAECAYVLIERDLSVVDSNQNGARLLGGKTIYRDAHGKLAITGDRGSAKLHHNVELAFSRGSARTLFSLTPRAWLELELTRIEMRNLIRILALPRMIQLDATPNVAAATHLFGLTNCESAVLVGVAQAMRPKEIARHLEVSVHTIRAHLRSIYGKMGVNSAVEMQKIVTILEDQ